jgi:hypothetical protein
MLCLNTLCTFAIMTLQYVVIYECSNRCLVYLISTPVCFPCGGVAFFGTSYDVPYCLFLFPNLVFL